MVWNKLDNEIEWWNRNLSSQKRKQSNGLWGKFGEFHIERCNLRSVDTGKNCKDSDDYTIGNCITEITEQEEEQLASGDELQKSEKGFEFELNCGCQPFVENDTVQGISLQRLMI